MTDKKLKSDLARHIKDYIQELSCCLDNLDISKIEETIDILTEAYKRGRKVFILGNGGSAANASHMAADLSKGTLKRVYDEDEPRFKVYSLTDNVAILTAFANDLSFSDVFVQQLQNLIDKDDVLIALSGSGNSRNVINAVRYANKHGAKTIGILGFKTGGKLANLVDCAVIVQSVRYGPCEDMQLILDHIITSWLAQIKKVYDKKKKKL